MLRRALLIAVSATLLGGCGDGEPKAGRVPAPPPSATASPAPTPAPSPRGGAPSGSRAAIDGWARALSRSDVRRASRYFGVPVVVAQGRAFRLRRSAEVRIFNDGLPCGARLLSVRSAGRFVVATFRLTERPGRTCDSPGETARVAFRFRGSRFSEWRQLPEAAPDGGEPAEPSDAEPA